MMNLIPALATALLACPKRVTFAKSRDYDVEGNHVRIARRYHSLRFVYRDAMNTLPPELQQQLQSLVREHGLDAYWDAFRENARTALALKACDVQSRRLGGCRIGGLPDLPSAAVWPGEDGLWTFIAQINLTEIPDCLTVAAPRSGMLYFFIERDDSANDVPHLLLHAESSELSTREPPAGAQFKWEVVEGGVFPAMDVEMRPSITLPAIPAIEDSDDDEARDALSDLSADLDTGAARLFGHAESSWFDNRMPAYLHRHGHGRARYEVYNNDQDFERNMRWYYESDRADDAERMTESRQWFLSDKEHHKRESKNWINLLQVESLMDLDMNWWDSGNLQFLIDERDLARGAFNHTYGCINTT